MNDDKPYYVLKAHDAMLIPENGSLALYYLKKVLWVCLFGMIVLCIIFRENLFSELGSGMIIVWLVAMIRAYTATKTERKPYPFEIQFYDDYMILYWEKYYYSPKRTVKQITKIYYKDITECEYMSEYGRMEFFGTVEMTWYDYRKDGSLPNSPTYHIKTEGAISYFYTIMDKDIDFVAELENHSPIKVNITKNLAG